MNYQNDDRRAAVRHIQELLRTLEISSGGKVTVPVDGIFGGSTEEAVRRFQAANGLDVTGEVNKATYDLLYEAALAAEFENSLPLPLYVLQRGQSLVKGEESDAVMILQAILNTLAVAYDDFEQMALTGVFDEETESAIKRFQMRNALPMSGIVDKATWNALIRNYNKYIQYS